MMEDSLKDTEILGKSIGSDIKSYIKTHSNEYTLGIKNQITLGFQNYFSALNSKSIFIRMSFNIAFNI